MGGLVVVFVTGVGRSGSTLLASLLGQVDGLCSVGEVRYLVERGLVGGDLCGCGAPVEQCRFWETVVDKAKVPTSPSERRALIAQEQSVTRLRQTPHLLRDRGHGHPWLHEQAGSWVEHLGAVHQAIADVSGRIAVDSSKLPSYGVALEATGRLDVRVVHLVRDPRGMAHSWSSATARSDRPGAPSMDRRDPYSAALLWNGWNEVARRLWGDRASGYVRIAYEDLVADPGSTLQHVLDELDLAPGADLGFLEGGAARLGCSHTVAGNPNRMRTGPVRIANDDRWVSDLSAPARLGVGALTALTRRRFQP